MQDPANLSATPADPLPFSDTLAEPLPVSSTLTDPPAVSPTPPDPLPVSSTLTDPPAVSPTPPDPLPVSSTLTDPPAVSPTPPDPLPVSSTLTDPPAVSPTPPDPLPVSSTLTDPPAVSPVNPKPIDSRPVNTAAEVSAADIQLPARCPKRGRPRGTTETAIGLPHRKKTKGNKPIPFIYRSTVQRARHVLEYFVPPNDARDALDGRQLDEGCLETNPENLPDTAFDENIDINSIRRYFTSDAWVRVQDLYETKKERITFRCTSCELDLHSKPSIVCYSCLEWHHLRCVGRRTKPKTRFWYCRQCLI